MKAVCPHYMSLKENRVAHSTWMPGNLSESLVFVARERTGSWTIIFRFQDRDADKGSTPICMLVQSQAEGVPWLWKLKRDKQTGVGPTLTSVLLHLGET